MGSARRKIVIVGAGGRLGSVLVNAYRDHYEIAAFNHAQLDLSDLPALRAALQSRDFDLLINTAAQTNVDRCEDHRDEAFLLNAEAPRVLAEICTAKSAKLIHISTDYVFAGDEHGPRREEDAAEPVSVYGESKRAGEENVLAVDVKHLVVRVSWVFGPERPSFVDQMLKLAAEKDQIAAVADKWSTPSYTRDLAEELPFVFDHPEATGLLHLANSGECTWQEYAQWAITCAAEAGANLKTKKVGAVSMAAMKAWKARRPVHTVLATEKFEHLSGRRPRDWRDAVKEYVSEFYSKR